MATGYVWNERFAWHEAGNALGPGKFNEPYPDLDRPETKRRLHSLIEVSGLAERLVRVPARLASEEELLQFHTREYVERIKTLSEAEGGNAGEAARFGPGGFDIARLAVGGCLAATEAVIAGTVENAYALVRPCGHHATADFGRGFCIFGNLVLAIHHAKAVHKVRRIAVVDWDVHHGNGTQEAFYRDPSVLTISLHQDRCYPVDSGGLEEMGEEEGRGYNINIPLPPGSGHGAYLATFEQVVLPALRAFRPALIFVASGFDAGANDPLGRMLCYSDTYRAMATMLRDTAMELCEGKLVACHEGGYSPTYVPFCGLAVLEAMAGIDTAIEDPMRAWYARLGGQELQPHQAAVIDQAAQLARRLG